MSHGEPAHEPTHAGAIVGGGGAGLRTERESSAPGHIWDALDAYVPPLRSIDSTVLARMRVTRTRGDDQPRLPLTLRIGRDGSVARR